mgnify:CR=1 FL=1
MGKGRVNLKKYNCPNCSAELYWDAAANALKCEYCEKEFQPEELDALAESANAPAPTGAEQVSRETTSQDRASDDSTKIDTSDLVVYSCKNCGAEVITSRSTVATTCAFCGRAISLTDKMVGNFAPEYIIPFAITEDEAKRIYKNYVGHGILSPSKFRSSSQLKKQKGIYAPFWLHSYSEDATLVVHGENLFSHRRGDDKVIEHHMFDVNMNVEGDFKSIPADGLKNLDNNLMAAIEPFDYTKLSDFSPAYMAGFYAEEYDENADETLGRVMERSKNAIETEAALEAGPYETKMVVSYASNLKNKITKYAMLPIWMFNVTYGGKDYQIAVNGETGKVAGKLPISALKLIGAGAGTFLGTQLLAIVVRLFM